MMRDSTMWGIANTKTFRLGSRKIQSEYGGNIQNIEKSMREVYIADEGKILVQTDQAGAEALIVAYECEPSNYRKLFMYGVKPHVYVGLHLFKDIWKKKLKQYNIVGDVPIDIDGLCNVPIEDLKKAAYWKDLDSLIKQSDNWPTSERYYYFAKQTCHSANYGIETQTFRMNVLEKSGGKIMLPFQEAERFLLVYRSLFPEIPERNERIRRQVEQTHVLYNMFGHPYYVTTPYIEENKWKEYFAWPSQSTVGMITNIAFARMQEFVEAENLDWDVMINGHDSVVSQCPIEEGNLCAAKQKEFIEQEFISTLDRVPFRMKSETMIGFNWAPQKEKITDNGKRIVINPMGLKELKGL